MNTTSATNERQAPTWESIIAIEPSLGHLLELAQQVQPADRPKPSAITFYKAAALRLLQNRPLLHGPKVERVVMARLEEALGAEGWSP